MNKLMQILIGSFILSIVHTLTPNHRIPIVIISKAEKQAYPKIFYITIITGMVHSINIDTII